MYPRKGIARPQSPFSTFMCLWAIYIFPESVHIFFCSQVGRPILEYINRSQTNEWWNWERGCAVPFLGIFVSNFQYCAFAMQGMSLWRCDVSSRTAIRNMPHSAHSASAQRFTPWKFVYIIQLRSVVQSMQSLGTSSLFTTSCQRVRRVLLCVLSENSAHHSKEASSTEAS